MKNPGRFNYMGADASGSGSRGMNSAPSTTAPGAPASSSSRDWAARLEREPPRSRPFSRLQLGKVPLSTAKRAQPGRKRTSEYGAQRSIAPRHMESTIQASGAKAE